MTGLAGFKCITNTKRVLGSLQCPPAHPPSGCSSSPTSSQSHLQFFWLVVVSRISNGNYLRPRFFFDFCRSICLPHTKRQHPPILSTVAIFLPNILPITNTANFHLIVVSSYNGNHLRLWHHPSISFLICSILPPQKKGTHNVERKPAAGRPQQIDGE